MRQLYAIEQLLESLKQDPAVEAVFLKGSFGRGEEDVYSDIDLYCLIAGDTMPDFLTRRMDHLSAYRPIIWKDDIFIVAPQLIAVYDDLLHIDLFTVTLDSLNHHDTIRVLYDPAGQLDRYTDTSSLALSTQEAEDEAIDAIWFLFQYQKAAGRGNALWAVEMLRSALTKFAKVLLHRYVPDRAQLGLKTIPDYLPDAPRLRLEAIYAVLIPATHGEAARLYREFLQAELPHLQQMLVHQPDTLQLLDRLLASEQVY